MAAAALNGGGLLVAQRTGTITAIGSDGKTGTLLDLSTEVSAEGAEQGLLGVAITTNSQLVASYTTPDMALRVSDLGSVEAPVWPGTELLVVPKDQPWHASGRLTSIGPDSVLVGVGDDGEPTGSPGPVQDPDALVGKILELNATTGERTLIAFGLRNPWGIAVDDPTGDLWVADVGQTCKEEINRVSLDQTPVSLDQPPVNFGWPNYEGTQAHGDPIEGAVAPVLEYPHSPHCAIIGGPVYRGEIQQLSGSYLFADYCTGEIFAYEPAGTVRRLPVGVTRPTWLGLDGEGDLLVASQDSGLLRVIDLG
ncbi:MAG: PQQ-dependent sugar dehydrogenase [Sulfitobacter sp.]|nr:PQQ-dependent sugar dehydrogenase [Sulfitobacter sp.]